MNFELMNEYPELKDLGSAEELIKSADLTTKKCFLTQGWALTQIHQKELFKDEFATFTDYLNSERFGYSRRQAYKYMNVYEKYKDYDVHNMHKIGITKMIEIAFVSNREEREGILEKAPKLTIKEVKEEVKHTKRFTQNINKQVTQGDSLLIKTRRIGEELLNKSTELIKEQEVFKNQFNEDLNNIETGLREWLGMIKSYPENKELEELRGKLLITRNELKTQ